MEWQEVRAQFPEQWVLIEAISAHDEADKRVVEQVAVLGTFSDSATAMRRYALLHREQPQREMFVFHTSRAKLDITIQYWLGLRRAS